MAAQPAITNQRRIARLARLYKATTNPLYVWQAIYFCLTSGSAFPDWVQDYLLAATVNLMHLMERSGADLGLGDMPYTASKPYRGGQGALKPGDALDGVSWALKFAGEKGASAFSRLFSDAKHSADLSTTTATTMLKGKQGAKEARGRIIQRRGLSTSGDPDRSIRRRIRKAKSIAGDED